MCTGIDEVDAGFKHLIKELNMLAVFIIDTLKKSLCLLGIHKWQQTVVKPFSVDGIIPPWVAPYLRIIKVCKYCGEQKRDS